MEMSLVQIVGGPRDGEYIPYIGRELRLPPALHSPDIRYDSYDFRYWINEDGSAEGRYVHREIAPGLSCP